MRKTAAWLLILVFLTDISVQMRIEQVPV